MPLGPPSHHGDDVPLGLAGAEKHLYQVNLDAGQLQVQRAILQLRVDYLSQLNTQTMLLAGAAVGMLSSLELEAIYPEHEHERTFKKLLLAWIYVFFTSVSLGSSIWVLYTSNNLVNLATMSVLHASRLRDVQGADTVLSLRMGDVREVYIVALLTALPALYTMTVSLTDWYISGPALIAVAFAVVHAIHSDHATTYHFEKSSGIHVGRGFDYSIANCLHASYDKAAAFLDRQKGSSSTLKTRLHNAYTSCIDRLDRHGGVSRYVKLEDRIKRAKHAPLTQQRLSMDGGTAPRSTSPTHRRLRMRAVLSRALTSPGEQSASEFAHKLCKTGNLGDPTVHHCYMLKSPSNKGPIHVLETVAVGSTLKERRDLLVRTPAYTPTTKRWWVLQQRQLSCFLSEEAWREKSAPLLTINLEEYTVLRTHDLDRFLTIALLPKLALDPHATHDAADFRSWYLCCSPPTDLSATSVWYDKLKSACLGPEAMSRESRHDSVADLTNFTPARTTGRLY